MAIPKGRVYTKSNGGDIGENETAGLSITYLGQTVDGYDVVHYTFFRKNVRMSYDAVRINNEYHYIMGSGHETNESERISQWDSGVQLRGTDALKKRAKELILNF